jgi:predicted ATP-grasp superfamily ATP-dependent carboligase
VGVLVIKIDINIEHIIEAFPALALVGPMASEIVARLCAMMMDQGVSQERIQHIIHMDEFVITIAGSVFWQIEHSLEITHAEQRQTRFR